MHVQYSLKPPLGVRTKPALFHLFCLTNVKDRDRQADPVNKRLGQASQAGVCRPSSDFAHLIRKPPHSGFIGEFSELFKQSTPATKESSGVKPSARRNQISPN